ncbi:hypothetical protein HHI36_021859 [Cryptolaemus montrouzieri]|uniref:Uncharacterized protein n=1 Tax=Cryptolaemus montrouzieri TaxID=559131 RepID=A0ABD2MYC0_9CUCU
MRKLEDEYIQNEMKLEDKVTKMEQWIGDLKLKLVESEKQLKAMRNKNEKMKTEQRNKDTIVEENQTSCTINPNMEVKLRQELTQREATIVFLKEKLENQKQSITLDMTLTDLISLKLCSPILRKGCTLDFTRE